jgi:hypothetical protein
MTGKSLYPSDDVTPGNQHRRRRSYGHADNPSYNQPQTRGISSMIR